MSSIPERSEMTPQSTWFLFASSLLVLIEAAEREGMAKDKIIAELRLQAQQLEDEDPA